MRPYEVVLVLEADADDATVDGAVSRLKDLVSTKSGTTGQVQKWGRRRFAYELKHRHEGYYALVEMNAEPEAISDIDRMLTLSDDIVRHKIIRIPESVAGRERPALHTETTEEVVESTGATS
jgi:small subunit ribosomal protein S6